MASFEERLTQDARISEYLHRVATLAALPTVRAATTRLLAHPAGGSWLREFSGALALLVEDAGDAREGIVAEGDDGSLIAECTELLSRFTATRAESPPEPDERELERRAFWIAQEILAAWMEPVIELATGSGGIVLYENLLPQQETAQRAIMQDFERIRHRNGLLADDLEHVMMRFAQYLFEHEPEAALTHELKMLQVPRQSSLAPAAVFVAPEALIRPWQEYTSPPTMGAMLEWASRWLDGVVKAITEPLPVHLSDTEFERTVCRIDEPPPDVPGQALPFVVRTIEARLFADCDSVVLADGVVMVHQERLRAFGPAPMRAEQGDSYVVLRASDGRRAAASTVEVVAAAAFDAATSWRQAGARPIAAVDYRSNEIFASVDPAGSSSLTNR